MTCWSAVLLPKWESDVSDGGSVKSGNGQQADKKIAKNGASSPADEKTAKSLSVQVFTSQVTINLNPIISCRARPPYRRPEEIRRAAQLLHSLSSAPRQPRNCRASRRPD